MNAHASDRNSAGAVLTRADIVAQPARDSVAGDRQPSSRTAPKATAVLVVIANYGTRNDAYLRRLLDEYRSITKPVHVVVLTNVPKTFGEDIEVVVQKPKGNPWGFPFLHKELMARRLEEFDLFIYSEDDTLVSERNIDAFLRATEALPANELAGFLRVEKDSAGRTWFPDVHKEHHWDPRSVVLRGERLFAYFTNEHAACYMLTREQFRRALQSGRFMTGARFGRYGLPETAATDPYTQCGFRKLICISQIGDFLLPHLPNTYAGRMGVVERDFLRHIEALKEIHNGTRRCAVLENGQTEVARWLWAKSYYEQPRVDLRPLIPTGTRSVLSYGCGCGDMEADLAANGCAVTAFPLDSVVGASAEARGFEIFYGAADNPLSVVAGRRFDCVLLSGILPLVREPERLLASLAKLLSPGGVAITIVPNLSRSYVFWRRMKDVGFPGCLRSFDKGGMRFASLRTILEWHAQSGLRVREILPVVPFGAQRLHRITGERLGRVLASEFVIVAEPATRRWESAAERPSIS